MLEDVNFLVSVWCNGGVIAALRLLWSS